MNNTWIKLHRNIIEWEWFDDKNCLMLLLYLNVKVNIKDKIWRGITVKRGSLVTGKYSITEDLGISIQQYRTALNKLIKSGEVVKKATNTHTLLSLTKWEKMQHEQQTDNKRITNEQQTDNKRITPTKESKEVKEVKESKEEKNNVFNFRKSLLSLGIDKNLVDDWLKVRKTKRATNTKTAFNGLKKQLDLCKLDNNIIIENCIENSWSGFKSDWLNNVTIKKEPKEYLRSDGTVNEW